MKLWVWLSVTYMSICILRLPFMDLLQGSGLSTGIWLAFHRENESDLLLVRLFYGSLFLCVVRGERGTDACLKNCITVNVHSLKKSTWTLRFSPNNQIIALPHQQSEINVPRGTYGIWSCSNRTVKIFNVVFLKIFPNRKLCVNHQRKTFFC